MKKAIKFISLITALLLLCLTFCGCESIVSSKAITEAKENRGYLVEGKDTRDIEFGGVKYIHISESEDFDPPLPKKKICIGEKDQPVLIAMTNRFFLSDDKEYIVNGSTMMYYFREDCVEKYEALMEYHPLNRIGTYIESGNFHNDSYSRKVVLLSESEAKMLVTAVDTAASEESVNDDYYDYVDNSVTFYDMDESGIFSEYKFSLTDIKDKKTIYLSSSDGAYTIGDVYYDAVSKILEKYRSDIDY